MGYDKAHEKPKHHELEESAKRGQRIKVGWERNQR